MRHLLVLAPAPTVAASTRFRLAQFFPALRAAGVEPQLRPFLDEAGFGLLYRPGAPLAKLAAAARALAGRLADLVRAARADAVLVHREAALVGPPLVEWILARGLGRPLLFDLDDAVWVPYASPTYGTLLSRLLKAPQKTDFTLAAARRIIAGNRHLADYARRFNAKVDVIPTVVDTDAFRPAPPASRSRAVPVLGWIGTHSSSQYLRAIVPALARLARRRRFVLRVVGGAVDDAPGLAIERRPWSLASEVDDFQSLDVGLYPLADDPWAHGKSGFKAVQYMACGVPVVASPVGVTREMIRDGENGYLAATPDDWEARLGALVDDAALRRRLGAAGRADAEARWSLAAEAPHFVDIVRAVVEEAA
jgi:glycosyltransferase involved in cell wall biosynthesis